MIRLARIQALKLSNQVCTTRSTHQSLPLPPENTSRRYISPNTYAPFVLRGFLSVAVLLVQDLHHSRLLVRILDQHASRATHVFDHIDDFAEA